MLEKTNSKFNNIKKNLQETSLIHLNSKHRKIAEQIKNGFISDFEEVRKFIPTIKHDEIYDSDKYTYIFYFDHNRAHNNQGFECTIHFIFEKVDDYKSCKKVKMNHIYIERFKVNPRRKGIGTILITKLTARIAMENNFEFISLHPTADSTMFWYKMGFTPSPIKYKQLYKSLNHK